MVNYPILIREINTIFLGVPLTSCSSSSGGSFYAIKNADELKQLIQHKAMVTNMPATMTNLPIRTDEPSVLQRLGDLSKLQPGQFNSRQPALMEMSSVLRAASQRIGLALDMVINGKVSLVNSSLKTTNTRPIPSLWEYLRLIDPTAAEKLSSSASLKLINGTVAAERPTPHFHAETCHSQTGRGILSFELLNKLDQRLTAEVRAISQEIYKQVLDIHRAAVSFETGINVSDYNIRSMLNENALSILVTYPRKPGQPTTWQTDFTAACNIPVEVNRAKKRERDEVFTVLDAALPEGGRVTRSGTWKY
jgi:hypothetical protein